MPRQYTNDILYHYTDYQAFDGILREAQLRVNNILNMNDAAEMRLFMTGLCDAVVSRLQREKQNESAMAVKDFFETELQREFYYSAYAACFSLYRDDAAQWERYGNKGRGVCIGFRGDLLQKMVKGVVSLQTVFYQDDMRSHELVEIFYELARESSGKLMEHSLAEEAINTAWICSAAFKHPSFSSEREVRLVVSPFSKEYFDVKPCYHVSTERIKKYYPLDLRRMCDQANCHLQDLISEIIIGPESTQSKAILQDYLVDHALDSLADKVHLSECPLRRSVN